VLGKAFRALAAHAEESLSLSRTGLGDSEKKALVKRKNTDDRRVRLVELTARGRALITAAA